MPTKERVSLLEARQQILESEDERSYSEVDNSDVEAESCDNVDNSSKDDVHHRCASYR